MKPYMRPVYAGSTRDVADLKQMEFPVWSRAISKQMIQNRPRDDYLQKTGAAYAAALFYGSLLAETRRQLSI